MKCRQILNLIPAALTGEMDDLTRRRFDKHIGACEACRSEFDELSGTWMAIELPKTAQSATKTPTQLKLFRNKRAFSNSVFANRAVTAAVIALIIILIMLPFIIGNQKRNTKKWYIQNHGQSAAVKYKQVDF